MTRCDRTFLAAAAALALACAAAPAQGSRRTFSPEAEGRWIGEGICYGPHRDGQRPGGLAPTRAQLREDLALLRGRWGMLRLYSARGPAEDLLAVIREDRLPFRVLLGAWIEPEARSGEPGAAAVPIPGAREENRAEVEAALRLARAYPEVVLALVVGNETQVSWSSNRTTPEVLVGWLREARRGTTLPVATADDFKWWVLPESERVAREVDLALVHIHPLWNGLPLDGALAFTRARYAQVAGRHPGLPLLLGEVGWATRRHSEGEQARLIRGEVGEAQQARFLAEVTAWARGERIPTTWFEAFDERWKGGQAPDEVEKHWGLWRSDRSPKAAVLERAP